jgi:4-diphosphocytidyl-2-C-methyl-D-erythritol kinase
VASEAELCSWAGEFSSDAPFFFSSGTAYCYGRGEKLESLAPLSGQSVWIAKPQEGLSTPLVYRETWPGELQERDPLHAMERILSGKAEFFNDLEAAAFRLLPKLHDIQKELISLGFNSVTMTGSGTAFFCMGSVHAPTLPGIRFYPVSFVNRKDGEWYQSFTR